MTNTTDRIGFIGVLTIVFIILKLVGIIHWSWIWILAPMWMSFLIIIGFIIIIYIITKKLTKFLGE